MVSYKLTYFNGRGAGEVSRQIFAYAGQQYEDNRVTQEQWPALKESEFGIIITQLWRRLGLETT